MTNPGVVQDILVMGVPDAIMKAEPNDRDRYLDTVAKRYVYDQFLGRGGRPLVWPVPKVEFQKVMHTLYADKEILAQHPVHDCENCREGIAKGVAHLTEHDDAIVAVVDIWYVTS